jgi:hypothetical protein
MTTQEAFAPEEWITILEGPTSAAMAVIAASRGGTFRETYAEAKFFAQARQHHGQSELLDAIVAHKPVTDHAHPHSKEEFATLAVAHLRDAVTLISEKATPQELADYRSFVTALCAAVAAAHREGGADVSPEEAAVIAQLTEALGTARE